LNSETLFMGGLQPPWKENTMKKGTWTMSIVFGVLSFALLSGLATAKAPTTNDQEDKCKDDKPIAPTSTHQSPFACNRLALDSQARKRHFDELGPALRSMRKTVRELPDGYEFEFPSDPKSIAIVAEWAAAERLCCPFFNIDLRMEAEGGPVWLRVTGREGTKQFIQVEGASWIKQ
jgi:hypothetical protein